MNNKKLIIVCSIVACIIIVLLISLFVYKEIKKSDETKENVIAKIESTKETKIEQNGVEVKKIKVLQDGKQVRIESTLKNNTKKVIKELFITIELYDNNDKVVSTFSKRIVEEIKINGSYSFDVYSSLENKNIKIKSAKIANIYIS